MNSRLKLSLSLLILAPLSLWADDAATVRFTLDFPGANPSHYEIGVQQDGHGTYSSNGQFDEQSEPATSETLQFTLSGRVRDEIFDLTRHAGYFSSKVDSGHKNIANTGAKTLSYKDAQRATSAKYNYSNMPPVERLTQIFQSLSTTLEYGRRLSYFHKYEKLALEADLKRMEELQKENSLGDVSAISAVLTSIANDPSVINVSRTRALRLLASAK
jgi:hypothetical protein